MNKLKSLAQIALFVSTAMLLGTSCSDDDKPSVPQPSKVIKKVTIYKSDSEIKLMTTLTFSYDKGNRLALIKNTSPLAVVNYSYSDDGKVSYNYASEDSGLIEVNTSLENGHAHSCKFSNTEVVATYSYTNDGYLKGSNNAGVILEYSWDNFNLKSITSSPRGTYDSKFVASTVSNNYSFDLNTLAQLIDSRNDYVTVVNTYGQMAGILGNRSKNIIEDDYYKYDFGFYQDGRLKDMTLVGSAEAYTFRIEYEE